MVTKVILRRGIQVVGIREYLNEHFGPSSKSMTQLMENNKKHSWVLLTQYPSNHHVSFGDNVSKEELLLFTIKYGS